MTSTIAGRIMELKTNRLQARICYLNITMTPGMWQF